MSSTVTSLFSGESTLPLCQLNMMIDKYLMMGWEVKGNMIVIDSFNGALHLSTNTKNSGIFSYSTLLFHPDYFVMGVCSATSTCILTWRNSLTVESRNTLFPLLKPIYKEHQLLQSKLSMKEGCTFSQYQMHDAKFIYT